MYRINPLSANPEKWSNTLKQIVGNFQICNRQILPKSFNFVSFHNELNELLKSEKDINYSLFENIALQILNAHAPVKKKIQRFNNNPFMTKQLRKAIMHRSRLKNVFNKSGTAKTWDSYKKQRNFCVNLLRKTKKSILKISMLRI